MTCIPSEDQKRNQRFLPLILIGSDSSSSLFDDEDYDIDDDHGDGDLEIYT